MLDTSNINAIEGKFKRKKMILKSTFLYKEKPIHIQENFDSDEFCIIYYKDLVDNCWFLTNKNLFISHQNFKVSLSLLKKVDFINLKKNPSEKLVYREIDLFTDYKRITLCVEEKSWPLIYNIFKFIVNKNL